MNTLLFDLDGTPLTKLQEESQIITPDHQGSSSDFLEYGTRLPTFT